MMPGVLPTAGSTWVSSDLLLVEILGTVLGVLDVSWSCRQKAAQLQGLLRQFDENIVYRGLGRVERTSRGW